MKYPKELLRLHRKFYNPLEPVAILAIAGQDVNSLELVFILSEATQVSSSFLSELVILSKRPPLSKYELKVSVQISSTDIISKEWIDELGGSQCGDLYLYVEGRTYAKHSNLSIQEFVRDIRNGQLATRSNRRFPPIISNIEVQIDTRFPLKDIEALDE